MPWPPDAGMLRLLVDLILLLVLVEAVYLYSRYRRGLTAPPVVWLPNLLSGALLMLALRFALTDAAWHWIVLCLSASGIAHLLEYLRHAR